MINKKDIQHIAKLARLGLTKKEIEKSQKKLSSILDYVEKLKEVDVSEVEPTSHTIKIENVMRNDEMKSQKSKACPVPNRRFWFGVKSQKLMALSPETKDGYLKVKSILK